MTPVSPTALRAANMVERVSGEHDHVAFVRQMVPVEPYRVYDSRKEPDGPLDPRVARPVAIGKPGAVVHVTAIGTTEPGFLSISGIEAGNATSLVNFDTDGTESANAPILLPDGVVYVTAIAPCHIAVDVYAEYIDVPVVWGDA